MSEWTVEFPTRIPPLASWLKARWKPKEGDRAYHNGEVVVVSYSSFWKCLVIRDSEGGVFLESSPVLGDSEFYDTDGYLNKDWDPEPEHVSWLPTLEDYFLLFREAGASYFKFIYSYSASGLFQPPSMVWVLTRSGETGKKFRADEPTEACAEALRWVLMKGAEDAS